MSRDSPTKACVILGAGASHDAAGTGTIQVHPEYRPPVTAQLFSADYASVRAPYHGAVTLTEMLAPKLARDGEDSPQVSIENELSRLAEHDLWRRHYGHVPAYLCDLFTRASRSWVQSPGAYVQLVGGLAETHHVVAFIVLNYDDLLEQAITAVTRRPFDLIDNYLKSPMVIKLHGSINWFVPLKVAREDWRDIVFDLDDIRGLVRQRLDEGALILHDLENHLVHEVRHGNEPTLLYPVLTAPLADKGPDQVVCPDSHGAALRAFLTGEDGGGPCEKFLIAGTSGLDEDLLSILHESVLSQPSEIRVHVVGRSNEGVSASAERFTTKVGAFGGARLQHHESGFRQFVERSLQTFLDA